LTSGKNFLEFFLLMTAAFTVAVALLGASQPVWADGPYQPDSFVVGRLASKDGRWLTPVGSRILSSDAAAHRKRGSVPAWDISAPEGSWVMPMAPGEVVYSGCNNAGGYGCWVWVRHDDDNDTSSIYCHLLSDSLTKEAGDRVSQWDVIGQVGWTGATSFGPHVHWEVRKGSRQLDPADFFDKSKMADKPFESVEGEPIRPTLRRNRHPAVRQVLVDLAWKYIWAKVDEKRLPFPNQLRNLIEAQLEDELAKVANFVLWVVGIIVTLLILLILAIFARKSVSGSGKRKIARAAFFLALFCGVMKMTTQDEPISNYWWAQLALIAGATWGTRWLLMKLGRKVGLGRPKIEKVFGWLFCCLIFPYAVVQFVGFGLLLTMAGEVQAAPSLRAPQWRPIQLTWWNGDEFTLDVPQAIWEDTWKASLETGADPYYNVCLGSSESQAYWRNTGSGSCSYAGACGPFQFMRATWRQFRPWVGASRYKWPDAMWAAQLMQVEYEFDQQISLMAHRLRFTGMDHVPPQRAWNMHGGQADYVWRCFQTVKPRNWSWQPTS